MFGYKDLHRVLDVHRDGGSKMGNIHKTLLGPISELSVSTTQATWAGILIIGGIVHRFHFGPMLIALMGVRHTGS